MRRASPAAASSSTISTTISAASGRERLLALLCPRLQLREAGFAVGAEVAGFPPGGDAREQLADAGARLDAERGDIAPPQRKFELARLLGPRQQRSRASSGRGTLLRRSQQDEVAVSARAQVIERAALRAR